MFAFKHHRMNSLWQQPGHPIFSAVTYLLCSREPKRPICPINILLEGKQAIQFQQQQLLNYVVSGLSQALRSWDRTISSLKPVWSVHKARPCFKMEEGWGAAAATAVSCDGFQTEQPPQRSDRLKPKQPKPRAVQLGFADRWQQQGKLWVSRIVDNKLKIKTIPFLHCDLQTQTAMKSGRFWQQRILWKHSGFSLLY